MAGTDKKTEHERTANNQNPPVEESVIKAHEEAEKDIEQDPDFQLDPAADLDEGEIARLEGED
jgi:hypothetical protein